MSNKKVEETKVIRVMETFAGIGAQRKAITNISKDINNMFEVRAISEWDARAVISYSLIHHDYDVEDVLNKNNLKSEKEINDWLLQRTFSLDGKKASKITRKSLEFKKQLVAASIITNNIPDMKKMKGEDINNIDMLTYSFPCQGLSFANMGRGKGISKNVDSTSNLIWEVGRIIEQAYDNGQELPKYLLMENVLALIGKKHIKDYEEWKDFLSQFGYKTLMFKLYAPDFGMVQTRKRIFAISILNPKDESIGTNIEEGIDKAKQRLSKEESIKNIRKMISLTPKNDIEKEEFILAVPNDTKSRKKMVIDNKDLAENIEKLNTLTTKQDRNPNIGMLRYDTKIPGKLKYRFITPREAYQVMGFESSDFDKLRDLWIKKNILTKESLYRQAGNSIAVKVLEAVFKAIYKIEGGKND